MKPVTSAFRFLLVSFLLGFWGAAPRVRADGEPVPAGSLRTDAIRFQFAIYHLPRPGTEPLAALDRLLKAGFPDWKRVETLPEKSASGRLLTARVEREVASNYAPPGPESLRYFGRGLSREQAEGLPGCQEATVVDFAYPGRDAFPAMQAALRLIGALADRTGGVVWDEATRQVFSLDAWTRERISTWVDGRPDMGKQIAIHAYNQGEFARAISLGMAKFGQPDLVVQEFPWSENRAVGNLINGVAQVLVEGAEVRPGGRLELDLRKIQHPGVREPMVTSLKTNAEGKGTLPLRVAAGEEGDPDNRLVRLALDDGAGEHAREQQDKILGKIFGWSDSVSMVEHDAAILAASQRARGKLGALRTAFQKGLAPGEFILLKAPFKVPTGGNEWMWVEVISWDDDRVRGLLKNEPANIPDLHGGQRVEIKVDEVFDYVRRFPDGHSEGDETSPLIQERGTGTRPVPGSGR